MSASKINGTEDREENNNGYRKSKFEKVSLKGINPGKSHGQGLWVSHERHMLDDSSSANRRIRSCSILLLVDAITGEGQGWCARLGLQIVYEMISTSPLLALI